MKYIQVHVVILNKNTGTYKYIILRYVAIFRKVNMITWCYFKINKLDI